MRTKTKKPRVRIAVSVGLLVLVAAPILLYRSRLFQLIDHPEKATQKFHKLYDNSRLSRMLDRPEKVTDEFHKLYYKSEEQTWKSTDWMGVEVEKNPFDLWILQEIIYEIKPDVIVEAGTWKGGSAYYMAHLLDILGHGKVITIDIQRLPNLPVHPRIQYLLGSSTSPEIIAKITSAISPTDKVLVDLDSKHTKDHVLRELQLYSKIVTKGSYLVVEDTNINGHPVAAEFGPGPMEALEDFLRSNSSFEIDKSREKFFMTFNPRGYLRKVRD